MALRKRTQRMSRETAERILSEPRFLLLSKLVVVVGTLNLAAAIALDVRTFAASVGPGYEKAFVPSFLLIFPLWAWTVPLSMAQTALQSSPKFSWKAQVAAAPSAVILVLKVAGIAAVIAMLPDIGTTLAGQPNFDPSTGVYTQNSHGSITVVTRATYERAVAESLRLFLCGAIIFSATAVAVAMNHWATRVATSRQVSP